MSESLYKQNIIDHYRYPRNATKLHNPTCSVSVANTSCGDEIDLELDITDGVLKAIGYEARGCAICVAAMSMLSEKVRGQSIDEASKVSPDEILSSVGMQRESGRAKCALLALEALNKALQQEEK